MREKKKSPEQTDQEMRLKGKTENEDDSVSTSGGFVNRMRRIQPRLFSGSCKHHENGARFGRSFGISRLAISTRGTLRASDNC